MRGATLWNAWEKVESARALIAEGNTFRLGGWVLWFRSKALKESRGEIREERTSKGENRLWLKLIESNLSNAKRALAWNNFASTRSGCWP